MKLIIAALVIGLVSVALACTFIERKPPPFACLSYLNNQLLCH